MKKLPRFITLFSLCFVLSHTLATQLEAREAVEVELTHWWKSNGERAALDEIRKAVEKRDAKFIDTGLKNYDTLRSRIVERLSQGYPPAMTQWLGGRDLKELGSIGAIQSTPSHWRNKKLEDILFPEVLKEIIFEGEMVGIPVGIHIQNTAFYNAKIYRELGLKIPTSWEGFLEQAKKIKQAGYIPIALSDEAWQLRAVFNSMLMEQLGVKDFQSFYDDTQLISRWREGIAKALGLFFQLRQYVDDGHKSRKWHKVAEQVINDKAALQVMGNFVKGEMTFAGKVAGKDFLCALAPGSKGTMLYAMDGFVLLNVRKPFLKKGQDLLFDVVLDPEVQAAFNSKKGGIPVRYGVDSSQLDSCSRRHYESWSEGGSSSLRVSNPSNRLRLSYVQNIVQKAWVSGNDDQYATADKLIKVIDDPLKRTVIK